MNRIDHVSVNVNDLSAAKGYQYEESYKLCYVRGPEGIYPNHSALIENGGGLFCGISEYN
ncbi:hypothetical protein DP73_14185 [Desulfosporosinus sp. HMP52]|uniref:hypothetical protein n=1 Tax=Desulfosporosinus sp. HMP52 TaxID=1487923 RepID=UPI00051FB3B7|nr:hypothetical protein [Desulfosporosinus sp. HMP52]KGK87406.1 hypothetical protein DP73_14185 [Desulfosporosinus sp. HMP52]